MSGKVKSNRINMWVKNSTLYFHVLHNIRFLSKHLLGGLALCFFFPFPRVQFRTWDCSNLIRFLTPTKMPKNFLTNRHHWCILWVYSLLKFSLIGLCFPWFFFFLCFPWKRNKTKKNKRNQRKTNNPPNQTLNQRKPKETEGNQRKTIESTSPKPKKI